MCHFNPILLISLHEEVSLLHLTIHSVREGTTGYHRSGHVDLQPRSTTPAHESLYTAEDPQLQTLMANSQPS